MVAASELRLMRSKSESAARVMVMAKKEDGTLLKNYRGFAAERSTIASPSPPLDLTKSGRSSKGIAVGPLRRISSSDSKSKSASLEQNGSDEATKNTSDDDDIIVSKFSGSSKRGGMGLLLRRMSSSGSKKNATLEGNKDETSGEKVVGKASSETEKRDICSGSEDVATPYGECEQKHHSPLQSVESYHNLRCSAKQVVQRFESGLESKSRVLKNAIAPRPPLPLSTFVIKKPKQPNISIHPSSSRNWTPEIKCNDSEASNCNISDEEGCSTSEPESSTIVRSSSGQSKKKQTPKIKNTTSKVTSTREGLPPIPVVRSSGNDLNSEGKTPQPTTMLIKKSRSGLGSAAGGGIASIRRSVSGWSNKPKSSSVIQRCSSESPGHRVGPKQLIKGGSSIQNSIATKNSNADERKTPENESILKPGESFEWTSSEVVASSQNTPKSLQSISFESNYSSLIRVTHSKASIIKMHTPLMSKSSEMMASSFAVSPREGISSGLGLEIVVCSIDDGKPILRAESAIGIAFSNEDDDDDDEDREEAENEGGREHLCISTDEICTPSSRGISGLEVDMRDCRFGYGYSLYVKSLEIYQCELELKKLEEITNENQEQETETHGEQEGEKLAEEKQNTEGDNVEEEEPDESTMTTGCCLPIITIVETFKIKKLSEHLPASAKPPIEQTTISSVEDDKNEKAATTMFCGHEWKQLNLLLPIITIVETTKIKQFSEHVATSTVTTANTSSKPNVLENTTTSRSFAEEDKNEKATNVFGGYHWKQLLKWCACFHT
jgi:hypothetical protein